MPRKVLQEYRFDHCPNCGSTHRLAGDAAKGAIKRGLFEKDAEVAIIELRKAMIDLRKLQSVLSGSTLPQVRCAQDMCTECGTIYGYLADVSDVPIEELMAEMGPPPSLRGIPDFFSGKGG